MAEPPDRMWRSPPALPCSSPFHHPPTHPIGSCWCIWDSGGGRGEEVGEGTQHPACPWPTPSLLPLHPKLLQTRLGASVTVEAACISQHKECAPSSAIT